jgi:hypothetical protein
VWCFDTRTCRQLRYVLLRIEKDEKGLDFVSFVKICCIMENMFLMKRIEIRQEVAISYSGY